MDIKRPQKQTAALAIGILASLPAQAATLNATVDKVLQTHPDVLSALHNQKAREHRITQSRSDFFPTLGITSQRSDRSGQQLNIDTDTDSSRSEAYLRLPLFNGFGTVNGLKSAKSDAKASRFEFLQAREQIALTVTQNYLDLIRLGSLIKATDTYIGALKKLKGIVDLRSKTGRVANVESAQASSRLVFAQNARESIRRDYQTAWSRYIELTGEKPQNLTPPRFRNDLLQLPVQSLFNTVVQNNPQVLAAYHNARARQADVGVARAELMPSLSVEYRNKLDSKSAFDTDFDVDTENQVNLSYEFPLGGGSIARTREASERRYAAKAQHRSAILDARQGFIQVYERLREAHANAPRLKQNLQSTKQVVEAYALQFNAGKRSLLDLLSAQNERYQAQSAMITNWYDRTLNTAAILAQTGELHDSLTVESQQVGARNR